MVGKNFQTEVISSSIILIGVICFILKCKRPFSSTAESQKIWEASSYRRSFKEKGFYSIYQGQKLPPPLPPGSPNSTGSVKDPLQVTSWKHMLDEKIEEKRDLFLEIYEFKL